MLICYTIISVFFLTRRIVLNYFNLYTIRVLPLYNYCLTYTNLCCNILYDKHMANRSVHLEIRDTVVFHPWIKKQMKFNNLYFTYSFVWYFSGLINSCPFTPIRQFGTPVHLPFRHTLINACSYCVSALQITLRLVPS